MQADIYIHMYKLLYKVTLAYVYRREFISLKYRCLYKNGITGPLDKFRSDEQKTVKLTC